MMHIKEYSHGLGHIGIPTSDLETTIRFYEKLGFTLVHRNRVPNGAEVAFLALDDLMIETYEEGGNGLDGAINHIAIACTEIEKAYQAILKAGHKVVSQGIESLPFWEKGVSFFIIEGPNKERIEYCEVHQ